MKKIFIYLHVNITQLNFNNMKRKILTTALFLGNIAMAFAANDCKKALEQVETDVKSYFDVACGIFYAICAIMALVGAFKVYSKWSSGDPDTTKVAVGWFGSLIFVAVVVTLIKSVFVG